MLGVVSAFRDAARRAAATRSTAVPGDAERLRTARRSSRSRSTVQTLIQNSATLATVARERSTAPSAAHPGQAYVPIANSPVADGDQSADRGISRRSFRRFSARPSRSGNGVRRAGSRRASSTCTAVQQRRTRHAPADRPHVDRRHLARRDASICSTASATRPARRAFTRSTGSSVNGTFRLGTGEPANRNRAFDVATGYGQNGIDRRSRRRSAVRQTHFRQRGRLVHVAARQRSTSRAFRDAGNAIFPLGLPVCRDVLRRQRHAADRSFREFDSPGTSRSLASTRSCAPRRTSTPSRGLRTTRPRRRRAPFGLAAVDGPADRIRIHVFDDRRAGPRARRDSVRGVVHTSRNARRNRRAGRQDVPRPGRAEGVPADGPPPVDYRAAAAPWAPADSSSSLACARLWCSPDRRRACARSRRRARRPRARRRRPSSRRRARPCSRRMWWCAARRDLRQVSDREHLMVARDRRIVSPTCSPTRPPMPASTSSNTSVGTRSRRARMVLSASITRDSSPPDATRASGRGSWPTLSATPNSTSSAPCEPISRSGFSATLTCPSGMPRSGSTSSTARARRAAPCCAKRRQRRRALRRAPRAPRARASRAAGCRAPPSRRDRARRAPRRPVRITSLRCAAVLLRQAEQQVAPPPHVLETRRVEVDRRLVLLELARQRLDARSRRCRTTPAAATSVGSIR